MSNSNFKPYIPADKSPMEFTVTAIIIGVILAIVFGGANAYLGLRVGMTISASIPAAVISMTILRVILRRKSILENNLIQTIASAGESLAAGCIFTLPAIFMWAQEWDTTPPSVIEIAVISIIGGVLGVLFMIPLRHALIVKEHGILPYPEGTACADILLAGEENNGKNSKASKIFWGLGIGAIYKFIADAFKIFPSEIDWSIDKFKGSGIGADVLPSLLGVGYICGHKVSSYLFAGGILSWFCLMPLIAMFGANDTFFPAKASINELGPWSLWSSYIRYIGAGALATGGFISLIKILPLLFSTVKKSIQSLSNSENIEKNRTNTDLPFKSIIIGTIVAIIAMVALPIIPLNIGGALLVVFFGMFFAIVSSRIVGIVGSSNNPVSGMTIAALLVTSLIFALLGHTDHESMVSAIVIGSIVAVVTSIASDASQDLKTGYILGASPAKQQIGEIIGVLFSAITIGGVLYLLNNAWGFGSKELAAPQATLMKMVVEGVMESNIPWTLVGVGAAFAIIIDMFKIPVLAVAIGMYLPIHLTLPLYIGGLLRHFYEKSKSPAKDDYIESGTLFASGLIAGEGLIGILLAVFAVMGLNFDLSQHLDLGNYGGIGAFIILMIIFIFFMKQGNSNKLN